MANEDYAILVGIKNYADQAFPALAGPVADVELVAGWLTSPTGGNLDPSRVTKILSVDPSPSVPANQWPPVPDEFSRAVQAVVLDENGRPIEREASRLYLYFSGHGFSQIRDQMPRASLYTANASRVFPFSIAGTYWAYWAKDAALFRDIVIIMDCCRDAESSKHEAVPAVMDIMKVVAAAKVSVFGIYAAPKGGKAQERAIPSRGNQVHGLLTHAVIDALETSIPDENGLITSDHVSKHIRERWTTICGSTPADPPEFVLPTLGPIMFGTRGLIPQPIDAALWKPGEAINLFDSPPKAPFARMTRSDDGASVSVAWAARPPEVVPVVNGVVTILLAPGFYGLGRGAATKLFQAGGDSVGI